MKTELLICNLLFIQLPGKCSNEYATSRKMDKQQPTQKSFSLTLLIKQNKIKLNRN